MFAKTSFIITIAHYSESKESEPWLFNFILHVTPTPFVQVT